MSIPGVALSYVPDEVLRQIDGLVKDCSKSIAYALSSSYYSLAPSHRNKRTVKPV